MMLKFIAEGIYAAPEFDVGPTTSTGGMESGPAATLQIRVTNDQPAHGLPYVFYKGRYAQALRAAFATETVPWCDLVAAGVDALAARLQTGDRAMVESITQRARALGFVGWARTLDEAQEDVRFQG